MARIPLVFRGVAVLLLAASTVVGQTPEPPAEFLTLDPISPGPQNFLRQFSADTRHPLLALMVDGELTSFDASTAQDSSKQDSSKIKPTPQTPSSTSKTDKADARLPDGCFFDGCPDDDCSIEMACPTVPNFLPFACSPPPPCCCRKCSRKFGHGHCGHCGRSAGGNPYLGWPCCPAWCFYGAPLVPADGVDCGKRCCCWRKRCCGCPSYGYPYGGWDMGCDGCWDAGFCGCCVAPPPPYCCRKCPKLFHKRNCGCQGCGYPYGGWGTGYDGWMDGGCCGYMPPPAPPCCCRKCLRKYACSHNYGYYGCCISPYYACPYYGCGYGCGKHHGLFHRCRCCQPPPYPYCPAPMMMPCMGVEPFCADCSFGGDAGIGMAMGDIID